MVDAGVDWYIFISFNFFDDIPNIMLILNGEPKGFSGVFEEGITLLVIRLTLVKAFEAANVVDALMGLDLSGFFWWLGENINNKALFSTS